MLRSTATASVSTGEADIEVRVEDAPVGLGRIGDDSQDLVVGDAFGGVSVPWHLATREAIAEVERVLDPTACTRQHHRPRPAGVRPGGGGHARCGVRARGGGREPADIARTGDGGNLVLVASDAPLDVAALRQASTNATRAGRCSTTAS